MYLPHSLTASQERIVDLANDLAKRFAERADHYDHTGEFPHENITDLHTHGYLKLVIPTEYGGDGANVLDMALAQEQIARGDGGTALATAMHVQNLGNTRDSRAWPEEVFATVCRTIVQEGGLINSLVTEPELGSISRGGVPSSTATPTEGGWLINGYKTFGTGAPGLRYHVVGVSLPPSDDAPQGEVANAVLDAQTPGIEIDPNGGVYVSVRSSGNSDVRYTNAFVPTEWLVGRRTIGKPSGGVPGVAGWNLVVAATYLGIGQAALETAIDYANTRTPPSLGKPIAELGHIQQWIGEMHATLAGARALLHQTARAWDEQPEIRQTLGAQIAAVKYLCTNGTCHATDIALRVAGGFSLTRRLPLERYFRDARAGLFNPPQDDLALGVIGRQALASRRYSDFQID